MLSGGRRCRVLCAVCSVMRVVGCCCLVRCWLLMVVADGCYSSYEHELCGVCLLRHVCSY